MALFVLLVVAAGAGAFAGSVLGHALGQAGLFAGGLIGGATAAPGATFLAARLGWIAADERRATACGAIVGFLVAAFIAVNTLSSPVGPVGSTLLTGVGGLIGRRLARRRAPQ